MRMLRHDATNCLLTSLLLLFYPSVVASCNIRRVVVDNESLNIDGYDDAQGPTVFVLGNGRERQHALRALVERDELLSQKHNDTTVFLSSSNSYSHDVKKMALHDYIRQVVDVPQSPGKEEQEPLGAQSTAAANETFYMFGHNDASSPWRGIASNYIIPPCGPPCTERGTKTLGIGGQFSGVSFHMHGPTFSETIVGRKHWFVLPLDSQLVDVPAIANMTMVHWYTHVFPALPQAVRAGIWECVLDPGEAIFFGSRVMHATLNLDKYNVFMSLFV